MAMTITIELDDAQEAAVRRSIQQRGMPFQVAIDDDPQKSAQQFIDQAIAVGTSLLASDADAEILKNWKTAMTDPVKRAELEVLVPIKIK